ERLGQMEHLEHAGWFWAFGLRSSVFGLRSSVFGLWTLIAPIMVFGLWQCSELSIVNWAIVNWLKMLIGLSG
ncbi:MAG TPA: hypothetical protein PKE66_10325, partial [Pyrinomonadaceae bacterium]|nr:hypothetical protein [Pyrinomonadaceae bacterium]